MDLVVALDEDKIKRIMIYTGWAAFGVGVAGLIGGGITEGLMKAHQSDFNNAIHQGTSDDLESMKSKGETMDTAKMALYIVGGIGLAAGVTMLCLGYFYNFESDQALADTRIPNINVAASPEFSGVNLGWTF